MEVTPASFFPAQASAFVSANTIILRAGDKTANLTSLESFLTNKQRKMVFERFLANMGVTESSAEAYVTVDNETTKFTYKNGIVMEEGVDSNNMFFQLMTGSELNSVPSFSAETEEKILELRREIGKLTKKLIKLRNNKNRTSYLQKKEERQEIVNKLIAAINESDPNNGFFSATKSMFDHVNDIIESKRAFFSESLRALVKEMYGESFTLTSEQEKKILNIYMLNLMLSGAVHNLNKARPQLIENYLKFHLIELGKQKGVVAKGYEPLSELEIQKKKTKELENKLEALMKMQSASAKSKPKAKLSKKPVSGKPKKGKSAAKSDSDSDD